MGWAETIGYVASYLTRAWLAERDDTHGSAEMWVDETLTEIACAFAARVFEQDGADVSEEDVWLEAARMLERNAVALRKVSSDWSAE